MRHKRVAVVAALYWLGVVATYTWAAIVRDRSGLGFLPFTALGLPWSIVTYPIAAQIQPHALAAVVYASLCFLLSGINAVLLYWLMVWVLSTLGKFMGRS
jgi:hypothetical protein